MIIKSCLATDQKYKLQAVFRFDTEEEFLAFKKGFWCASDIHGSPVNLYTQKDYDSYSGTPPQVMSLIREHLIEKED